MTTALSGASDRSLNIMRDVLDMTGPNTPLPYGSGLMIRGTQLPIVEKWGCMWVTLSDSGACYGYCYQPQILSSPEKPVSGLSSYTEHGYRPGIDPPSKYGPGYNWHPYCATREEAVQWLLDRQLLGQVQRYAHTIEPRDRTKPVESVRGFNSYLISHYRPWLTAGVTDVVSETLASCHTTPLGVAAGFALHDINGGVREVNRPQS